MTKPSLLEETLSSLRGTVRLLIGDRRAADHFDFSQRGLVGSFIAFLIATTINALLPSVMGIETQPGEMSRALITAAFLYGLQIAFAALALRQMKRLDGFVPYLTADNWCTVLVTIISIIAALVGLRGEVAVLVIGLLVLVLEINVARLIVTLTPLQIAIFIIAQLVGGAIGLIFVAAMLPVPPDVAAQLASFGG